MNTEIETLCAAIDAAKKETGDDVIMRKIWSPHLDAANGCLLKEVYMFIRYGLYNSDCSVYDKNI